MTRLIVHVEGQTEETFVHEVLAPHLYARGFHAVSPRLLGNARARVKRGGIKSWTVVREEVRRHLAGDGQAYATTMVDYYALPDDWPGRTQATLVNHDQKPTLIQNALKADFGQYCAYGNRFLPHVIMHEFEGLLFSDCPTLAASLGKPALEPNLQAIRDGFASPEHINDSPHTAPSKRIVALMPGYEKPLYGTIAALDIGLEKMRAECANFDGWVASLEGFAA